MKIIYFFIYLLTFLLSKKPLLEKTLNILPKSKKCFIILPFNNLNILSMYTKNRLRNENKISIIQDNKIYIYNPKREILFKKLDNNRITICYKNNNKYFSLKNWKIKIYNGKYSIEKAFEEDYNMNSKKKILKNFIGISNSLNKLRKKSDLINTLLKEK